MNAENNLGKKIKELRKGMFYTQEKLAELTDIDSKHLSKIETGVHLPTYKTLKKLSEILDFNLQDMDSISDKEKMVDKNPLYQKSLKLLNSAKNDDELKNYYTALKFTNRLMHNK